MERKEGRRREGINLPHGCLKTLAALFLCMCIQELMNNSELISRIATALIKGDMYERVSCLHFCEIFLRFYHLFELSLKHICRMTRSHITSFQLPAYHC